MNENGKLQKNEERCNEGTRMSYAVYFVYVLSEGSYIMKYFRKEHVDKSEITEMEHTSPKTPIFLLTNKAIPNKHQMLYQ